MYILENYDIAFSRDPANPQSPEVALLVVERADLPPLEGRPHKAFLVSGSAEHGTEGLRQLRLDFLERAGPPRRETGVLNQVRMDLPLAVFDLLYPFAAIWLCEVDEGQVVSEHELSLYKEEA